MAESVDTGCSLCLLLPLHPVSYNRLIQSHREREREGQVSPSNALLSAFCFSCCKTRGSTLLKNSFRGCSNIVRYIICIYNNYNICIIYSRRSQGGGGSPYPGVIYHHNWRSLWLWLRLYLPVRETMREREGQRVGQRCSLLRKMDEKSASRLRWREPRLSGCVHLQTSYKMRSVK